MKAEEIKNAVKSGYAKVALLNVPCCGTNSSCCGSANLAEDISRKVGYGDEELKVVPEGANLGLGCGNPVALASLGREKSSWTLAPEPASIASLLPPEWGIRERSSGSI